MCAMLGSNTVDGFLNNVFGSLKNRKAKIDTSSLSQFIPLGVIIGGGIIGTKIFSSYIEKNTSKPEKRFDFECPNMVKIDIPLCNLFTKFTREGYDWCEKEHKEKYKNCVSIAIEQCEGLMEMENEILSGKCDLDPAFIFVNSEEKASQIMKNLRSTSDYIEKEVFLKAIKELQNAVLRKITYHLMNIQNAYESNLSKMAYF